jgi:hypothetical protein
MKNFRGLKFSLLSIRANTFDGYGLTIGGLTVVRKGSICLLSDEYAAFSINLYNDTYRSGLARKLSVYLFGLKYHTEWIVRPQIVDEEDLW